MRNKSKGFSLIELLIVVAIILIIAAIAIPNLLRARITANETSAVGSIKTINTASVQYSASWSDINNTPNCGFPNALTDLQPPPAPPAVPTAADLIDNQLATGTKGGYTFVYTRTAADTNGCGAAYVINAEPITYGTTGQRSFCTDQSGVIRQQDGGGAVIPAGTCPAALGVLN